MRVDVVDRRALATTGLARRVPQGSRDAQAFVSVGSAVPGHSVEIRAVDTDEACHERQLGEIVVSGPSVSPHYWGSRDVQQRRLLHTGDVGYVAEGHLFVVDRLKDLVIVAGENYASSDIEAAAATVTGVRIGRIVAFSAVQAESGTEGAVVVAEIDLWTSSTPAAIRDEVRSVVRARVGLRPDVVLVAPGVLEKTTSGKLRRRSCAALYRTGGLRAISDVADLERLQVLARRRRLTGPFAPLIDVGKAWLGVPPLGLTDARVSRAFRYAYNKLCALVHAANSQGADAGRRTDGAPYLDVHDQEAVENGQRLSRSDDD